MSIENSKPTNASPAPGTKTFDIKDYQGGKSTLCTGCGHDNITQHIINAYFKAGVPPTQVAKISGIGCSSKTPAYFLNQSHGFNTLHGRMAAVATGAKLANHTLNIIGVSGDGDTASIGLGGFLHLVRRNLPMVYIIENNGVYGLTKGQFSATADFHSTQKSGELNPFTSMDVCALAIEAGCEFVARSFSGDAKQLVPLIEAAIFHPGTAVIDIISPCITYANHDGSTKSYDYVKEHKVALQELGFITERASLDADYKEGETIEIELASGRYLTLKKLAGGGTDAKTSNSSNSANYFSHNFRDPISALNIIHKSREKGEILTGLLYFNPKKPSLVKTLELDNTPLAHLNDSQLMTSPKSFDSVLQRFT